MSNPKLALIPSGYNTAKVFSILPNDGSGDFTFARTGEATKVNKDNLIETVATNVPRLNWLNSDCPNLLLESASTNSHTYSELSTGKTLTGATLTNNKAIAPTGVYNAMEFKEDTSTGKHKFQSNSLVVISSSSYTLSMFVKKNSASRFVFINAGSLLGVSGSFNLDTQAVTGSVQLFETYPNGWYRIGLTAVASGSSSGVVFVQLQQGTSDASYTGDESSMFIWGLQFEQSTTVTSYIPNITAGAITRNAETCSVTTPTGVTQIVETFSNDTTNTITSIPTTYTVSNGNVKKVIMT